MDWNYIAGFFDGEGSISHNGKGFRITIPQTNEEILEKICAYTGIGYVVPITKRKAHWKDSWVYYIAKQEAVRLFLRHIAQKVVVKRKSIRQIMPGLEIRLQNLRYKKLRSQKRVAQALTLRRRGLSYRKIGDILTLDHGYIRRIVLRYSKR